MLQLLCKVWLWMDLFSAANIFLKLRDDLTVSKRRKHLFLRIFRLFCISSGKIRCNFKTSFSKQKGMFWRNKKKKSFFRHWFPILEIHLQSFFASKDGARKTEFFAYVISRKWSINQQSQLRNNAFHVKTSQSAKN